MAGNDIAMNQFQVITDAAYIYGEAANGSQGKIKKSDLFSILFQDRGNVLDVNDATKSGTYKGHNIKNAPITDYGMLIVFKSGIYFYQFFLALNSYQLFVRRAIDSGLNWYEWKSISIT